MCLCCFVQCSESSICHSFELLSSALTFPVTQHTYKLQLDAWWNFGFTVQSGCRPPSRVMHQLTCTNVCTSLVQVRLWPLCWMQAQLLWLREPAGVIGGHGGSNCRLFWVFSFFLRAEVCACAWMLCLDREPALKSTCGRIAVITRVCESACGPSKEISMPFYPFFMRRTVFGKHLFSKNTMRIMTVSSEHKTLDVLSHLSPDFRFMRLS